MWNKLLCFLFEHGTVLKRRAKLFRVTPFSFLCERCDVTVYEGRIREQIDERGRQPHRPQKPKDAPDYWNKDREKYAVSEEGAA